MENKLTPEQALQYLTNVSIMYKGTLEEHKLLQQALELFKNLIKEKKNEQETQRQEN
jgi:hypothetical protein